MSTTTLFFQNPQNHLDGCGCEKFGFSTSAEKNRFTIQEFIAKASAIHNNIFDYSKVNYKNCDTKVIIICPQGHEFYQTPRTHYKHGCSICACIKPQYDNTNFINKAKLIHGELFDYSNINYINYTSNVDIRCIKHNVVFNIQAGYHLRSNRGCPMCIKDKKILDGPKKSKLKGTKKKYEGNKTTEMFIEDAIKVHGNNYDYSKVNYINCKTKVEIICKLCQVQHSFFQRANTHLNGSGCPQSHKTRPKSQEQFIKEAIKIHGNKYDYSKVKYIDCKTKIEIVCNLCPTQHSFFKNPSYHLKGQGCKKIYKRACKSQEQFIKDAIGIHGNKYNYSKVKYIKGQIKVEIICNMHNFTFLQSPEGHLSGKGCKKCAVETSAKKQSKTKEEFIKQASSIHDNKYDYSMVNYINKRTEIIIICKAGHKTLTTPYRHLSTKLGCDICKQSQIKENLQKNFIEQAEIIHGDKYDYSQVNYINNHTNVTIICKKFGHTFKQLPKTHIYSQGGCTLCLLCPSCELFRIPNGSYCSYCKPLSTNTRYKKTKEYRVVAFLKSQLPDYNFIHNKSVGSECIETRLFPDIRYECSCYFVIVEVDEFRHKGASYQCEEKRMRDIVAQLRLPCVFIRYNPDSTDSSLEVLLDQVKYYLDIDNSEIEKNNNNESELNDDEIELNDDNDMESDDNEIASDDNNKTQLYDSDETEFSDDNETESNDDELHIMDQYKRKFGWDDHGLLVKYLFY
jgi:hypothetical protein